MSNVSYIPVKQFYNGKSILVTGGTGFLGKVLIEKLLWSCPGIKKMYVLMRPNNNQHINHRLEEMLKSGVFERLRATRETDLKKIVPVEGDVVKPSMGISQYDTDILTKNVSVVFHSAATVKFNDFLKRSVAINMVGTKNVMKLCHKMPELKAFVHISTAYSNTDRLMADEIVYHQANDPEKVIHTVEMMEDDLVPALTPKVIGDRENAYVFTKAMAEKMVYKERLKLPITIIRPAIVMPSMREPVPGWLDNWTGPTGFLAAVTNGTIRAIHCHNDTIADLVPVDMVANLIICAAWRTATKPHNGDLDVYHSSTCQDNPITWVKFINDFMRVAKRSRVPGFTPFPYLTLDSSKMAYYFHTFVLEGLPAFLIDFIFRLSGGKSGLYRIHRNTLNARQQNEIFLTNNYIFSTNNTNSLSNLLQGEDLHTFSFDVKDIQWHSYIETYWQGVRRLLLQLK